MATQIGLGLVIAAIAAWFWPHCAQPALAWQRAGPLTTWLVFAVSALLIVVNLIQVAVIAMGGRWYVLGWLVGDLPWMIVVGIGYTDRFATLVRITRGR